MSLNSIRSLQFLCLPPIIRVYLWGVDTQIVKIGWYLSCDIGKQDFQNYYVFLSTIYLGNKSIRIKMIWWLIFFNLDGGYFRLWNLWQQQSGDYFLHLWLNIYLNADGKNSALNTKYFKYWCLIFSWAEMVISDIYLLVIIIAQSMLHSYISGLYILY